MSKQDVLHQLDGLMARLSEIQENQLSDELSKEVMELLQEASDILKVAPPSPTFQAWFGY